MKIEKPIFTVTTVRRALANGHRAVGFYHKFEEAEDAVINNVMDINEHNYYFFAVIEETYPGIYTVPRPEHWYKWNRVTKKYTPCEKPARFKQVCAWGMG